MGDAWLIIAVFVFAFILWVSTGGPSRPISFAGPYITPITTPEDTQEGYGSLEFDIPNSEGGSGERVWGTKSVVDRFENRLNRNNAPASSAAAGSVSISSGSGGPSGTQPSREYVTLRASGGSPVNVTGWRLVSEKTGVSATIPQAAGAPARGAALSSVTLAPGDEVIITTGASPVGSSFRENKCTAYLDRGNFVPALSASSCPSPSEELGDFYQGSASSYDACRSVVSRLPRCQAVAAPREASASCKAFIDSRLSYEGCVNSHFNDGDFRGDTWRIYLNRTSDLWRSDNETIKLLDTAGRVVDTYSY